MPTIPDFWEGGLHDPIEVEKTWREFVRSLGGQVIEDIIPEPREFENADFLFPAIPSVLELKEIVTAFDRSQAFHKGFGALMKRVMDEDPNWRPLLFGGTGKHPEWFNSELVRLFRPPLTRILKKANRQIRDTKAHLKISSSTGTLLLVNDGFTVIEPHFIRALVGDILLNSYSSIDCFVYMTVNRYVEVTCSDVPRLLWMPSYSDKAPDTLVKFVDDLGRRWYDFLETKIGPFTIPREEIPQEGGEEKTIRSRAIVLPIERKQ